MIRLLVILAVLTASLAAQQLELRAPGPGPFPFGERIVFELRLAGGGESARLGALPAVAGLHLASGTPTVAEGEPVWRLQVDALRPGRHRLPPIAVDDGSVTLKSEPLVFEVTEQAEAADELALELAADRPRAHVGEIVTIEIRLRHRIAFFRDFALQPFGRRLALPVMLSAPFWSGDEHLEALAPESGSVGLVLDDELVQGEAGPTDADGRREVRLARPFRVLRAGTIRIVPVVARFDFATDFEDDFIAGRRPVDRRRGRVYSEALELTLLEPPTAGRPEAYFGAVGRFEIETASAVREIEQGELFTVDLILRGDGNLASLRPPELDRDLGLRGFHVFGRREVADATPGKRTFRYEIAALDAALPGLPALELAFFDPGEGGGYRAARSAPIAIRIRPRPGFRAPAAAPRVELRPGIDDIFGLHSTRSGAAARARSIDVGTLWFVLSLPILGAFLLFLWSAARERDRIDPVGARARRARSRLRRALRDPDQPRDLILADFLGARIGRSGPSLVRHELEGELRSGGLPADLAREAAAVFATLIARRYRGEGDRGPTDAEILELAERIERAGREGEGGA